MDGSFWRSEPAAELRGLAKGASPRLDLLLVQREKRLLGHVDLAAHLADVGHVAAFQLLRNVLQRADIGGDVLALRAVAAGRGGDEFAALIAQRHRQPVDLRLGGKIDLVVAELEKALDAADEVEHVLFGKRVVERQHRHRVPDLPEAPRRRRADLLRRRVRRDEFGKALLDGVVALAQRVVFGVGDAWRVVLIVALVVPFELQRQPHVLDLGLRLGELGDVGKGFRFCCLGHDVRATPSPRAAAAPPRPSPPR